jgi:hypothetical protein
MHDTTSYERAKKRVDALKGWYIHLLVFAVVNAGLIALDLIQGDGLNWAYWALIGWGIGLAIHTAVFWLEVGPLGTRWEERKIRELMDREQREGHS